MSTEEVTGPENASALDSFFFDQALYGRYRLPMLIVFVTGVVWGVQPVAIYYALDVEVRDQIQNAIATDVMAHFLAPVVLWILFWLGFVVLGYYVAGARMRMGRLFKLTGWGMLPFVPIGLVRGAVKHVTYQGAELPIGVLMGQFPSEWEGYKAIVAEQAGDPLLVAATVGSCLFLILSAYVWVYAFKYSSDTEDRRDHLTVVAVPTLLYVAYVVVSAVPM